MLSVIFFCLAAFVSIFWLGLSGIYVETRIGWDNMMSMNPSDLAFFITAVFVPVVMLWVVIGFIHYAFAIRRQGKFLEIMLYHMKKSSDQNSVITRNLLESRELLRNSETLKYIDTAVADLNNTITEIAIRFGIMRKSSVEELWHKVSEGDRWAFCNVILDNSNDIKGFDSTIAFRVENDKELAAAIRLFCDRFEHLFDLLNLNENNRPLADIIENSSLGALYTKLVNIKKPSPNPLDDEEISESYIRSLFTDEPVPEEDTKPEKVSESYEEISVTEIPITSAPSAKKPFFKKKESKVTFEVEGDPAEDSKAASYDWEKRKKEILSRYGKPHKADNGEDSENSEE